MDLMLHKKGRYVVMQSSWMRCVFANEAVRASTRSHAHGMYHDDNKFEVIYQTVKHDSIQTKYF